MRYAILSDVHANVEALDRALADAARCGATRTVCLGDVVGYGPQPAKAVARVRQACSLVLAGNHDDAVSGRGRADLFNGLAADAVARHREALSSEDRAWLKSLPYTGKIRGALLAHGDFVDPPKFYYVDDEEGAAVNFEATDAQLMFVGHTHTPALAVVGDSGAVHLAPPQDFTLEPNKRYIVNPGSVGYPRECDGSCRSSYVIYDSDAQTVEFRFLPFSVASVMQRGPASGRRRLVWLLAAAAGAAALAAALAFALRPAPKTVTRTVTKTVTETNFVAVASADDPALLLAEKTLTLRPEDRKVRANLSLGPGPADLTVEFRDARGQALGTPFRQTVKESHRRTLSVPAGAAQALFAVRRPSRDAPAAVKSFAPTAEGAKTKNAKKKGD